ncbi:MAG: DUF4352 domain-containing protein [Micromonosporaceae bacterium]|nr:DUF4352 domain-containing protein [Micromonosporaceae bacterium]
MPPAGWPAAPPPPPKKANVGLIIGLVAGGVVLLLCLCGGVVVAALSGGDTTEPSGADPAAERTEATGDESPEAEPEDEPTKVGKIGKPVRDGKFEFVVSKVKCGVQSVGDAYGEKAQGQFCLISLSIKNIGDEAQMFNDFDQKAYSADDKEYEVDSKAGWHANENNTDVWLNEINPGNKIKGVLVFDIPKGGKLAKLELHDSSFSGGVTVAL